MEIQDVLLDSMDVSVFLTTFRSGHKLFWGVSCSKEGFVSHLDSTLSYLFQAPGDSGLFAGRVLDAPALQACALWVNEGAIV